ncbi:MAG: RsmE family RNA methyltransferase, partial [Fimbriimonadaceae bacterium]
MPRAFVPGLPADLPLEEPFELPAEELEKFRKVLRLSTGDQVAVLPNDGRLLRCELDGRRAKSLEVIHPETDAELEVTMCLGMPRADKLEESVRMGSEMGVARFEIFESQRSVVRWDDKKRDKKLQRLEAIAKEASEVCFRTKLPQIEFVDSLE